MEAPCVFKNRQQVDKVCLMKGELPAGTGEIAIDRMYADNNNLSVGDTLGAEKEPGRLPAWWHFPTTAACFRITTIPCLTL